MRFLMLNWRDPENPKAGGAERVTQAYLADLVHRGHEAWWFAHAYEGCEPETVIDGIHIVRAGGMFEGWRKAKAWYRTQPRFDLVIDQHHGIPWYAPWWCRTNNVSYIHEVLGPIWSAFYPFPLSYIGRIQERWTHWFYRNVPFFTASSCTKEKLQEHGVKDVTQIPYGVDTVALPQLPPKQISQPLRLIVVSRLAPNKRIGHAIQALSLLRQRQVDARLTIVGGGEEEQDLKALAESLNLPEHTTFTGRLDEAEKDRLLKESHFLLHTSQREGWGLNVIEANAMGTPAIVYPVEGLIESTLDEVTGLVSKDQTPNSLADRIHDAITCGEGYYDQWRVKAWERAKEFHWSQVLPKASDWFEKMAQGSGK